MRFIRISSVVRRRSTVPGPGVNKAQAIFIEMFITSALVLAVLMLAVEKHNTTPFALVSRTFLTAMSSPFSCSRRCRLESG